MARMGTLGVVGATLVLLLALLVVFRLHGLLQSRLQERASRRLKMGGVDIGSQVGDLGSAAIRAFAWVASLLLGYLWLVFTLKQLPYTESWGWRLESWLANVVKSLGTRAAAAAPGLFIVLLIVLLARLLTRV